MYPTGGTRQLPGRVDLGDPLWQRNDMESRPASPALWVLESRRTPSAVVDPLAAERFQGYAAMSPGDRLARALALSSFALRLRERVRRSLSNA